VRWCPKQPPILTTELRRAFIADAIARVRDVHVLHHHEASRFLQAQVFLILKRRHPRERLEVLVERRSTHADQIGKHLDSEVLGHVQKGAPS